MNYEHLRMKKTKIKVNGLKSRIFVTAGHRPAEARTAKDRLPERQE
jgi:hypothetical protein